MNNLEFPIRRMKIRLELYIDVFGWKLWWFDHKHFLQQSNEWDTLYVHISTEHTIPTYNFFLLSFLFKLNSNF